MNGRHGFSSIAPPDFRPDDLVDCAIIDRWYVFEHRGRHHLFGQFIAGHPEIDDGPGRFRTSELVWIDEGLGWAQTRNTLYKLGVKMDDDEIDDIE